MTTPRQARYPRRLSELLLQLIIREARIAGRMEERTICPPASDAIVRLSGITLGVRERAKEIVPASVIVRWTCISCGMRGGPIEESFPHFVVRFVSMSVRVAACSIKLHELLPTRRMQACARQLM
jgi:hypothetical protein